MFCRIGMLLLLPYAAEAAYFSPPANMTVYRVTPANDTGVISDRDTGDDGGDVFFTMYEAILPIYCPENPRDSICDNYVLANEQHNVYRQVKVEVDPNFGAYSGCNPQPDGSFDCHTYWHSRPRAKYDDCWWNGTIWGRHFNQSFAQLCNPKKCACAKLYNQSVGMWPCVFCRTTDGPDHNQTALWRKINSMCSTLNGTWYSTRTEGKCPPGKRPGDGKCFWRDVELQSNVNASCVRNRLFDAIKKHNKACFTGCPQPTNMSSPCWADCLLNTITGTKKSSNSSLSVLPSAVPPMTRQQLVRPFLAAFDKESDGGCPAVPLPAA
jgi:hypothetical protein